MAKLLQQYGIPQPYEDGLPVLPDVVPAPNYQIGDMLLNRYEVKELKHGSMGDVYHCFDHLRSADVALKTIISSNKTEHSYAISFQKEIEWRLRLPPHPNVLSFQRIESIDGYYYIVSQWVRGNVEIGNKLTDWLEHYHFSLEEIVRCIQQICCGLTHCYQHLEEAGQPYVYRDLKPDNLLIGSNNILMLGDFSEGYTPGWCAPELLRKGSHPMDQRCDVYSLGMIAGRMLGTCSDFNELWMEAVQFFESCLSECPAERPSGISDVYTFLVLLCEKYHFPPYIAERYTANSYMEQFNKETSLINLGRAVELSNPLDSKKAAKEWYKGVHISLNDYKESVSSDDRAFYQSKSAYNARNYEKAIEVLGNRTGKAQIHYARAQALAAMGDVANSLHNLFSAMFLEDDLTSYDLYANLMLDYPQFATNYQNETNALKIRLDNNPYLHSGLRRFALICRTAYISEFFVC